MTIPLILKEGKKVKALKEPSTAKDKRRSLGRQINKPAFERA